MKRMLLILPMVLTLNCFGQGETKEDFVNEVIHSLIDSSFRYYYIDSQAYNIYELFSTGFIVSARRMFRRVFADSIVEQIIPQKPGDTVISYWNASTLKNALVCNIANCFRGYTEVNKLRKKYYRRVFPMSRMKYENTLKKMPPEDRVLYRFSKPVISSRGNYGLIMVRSGQGYFQEDNYLLFEKNRGKWHKKFCSNTMH